MNEANSTVYNTILAMYLVLSIGHANSLCCSIKYSDSPKEGFSLDSGT